MDVGRMGYGYLSLIHIFMKRTEETLSESNAGKRLAKAERDIHALEVKKNKLVDMRQMCIRDGAGAAASYLL